ncbi:MAG TPA: universal stress protein, partial [Myxococcota bacterium]|nr:universal stress protein [Myxococcota bacterium]
MKILCATDFSESSTHAANVAARWAHLLGDTLVLAHAVDLTLYPAPAEQGMYPANFEAVLIDGAEETLAREANDLRRHGVIVETQVLLGPAGIAIAAHADKVQARLIVLGSHGMQPLRRWLWGSVAEAVTQHARQPTLVVSPEALRLPGETEGLRLLVALDESAASDSAVHWVRTLRRSLPVDVTFLHYYHPVAERARLGLADTPRASVGDDVQVAGVVAERLRKRVGDLPGDGDVAWLVESNWMSVGARLS